MRTAICAGSALIGDEPTIIGIVAHFGKQSLDHRFPSVRLSRVGVISGPIQGPEFLACELLAHTLLQVRIGEQRPGGDPGSKPDHERRAQLAVVDQQRQQGLEPHVTQRGDRVARIRNPLDVEAVESAGGGSILEHSDSAPEAFLVKDECAP